MYRQAILLCIPCGKASHVEVIACGVSTVAILLKFKLHFQFTWAQSRPANGTGAARARAAPHAIRVTVWHLSGR